MLYCYCVSLCNNLTKIYERDVVHEYNKMASIILTLLNESSVRRTKIFLYPQQMQLALHLCLTKILTHGLKERTNQVSEPLER